MTFRLITIYCNTLSPHHEKRGRTIILKMVHNGFDWEEVAVLARTRAAKEARERDLADAADYRARRDAGLPLPPPPRDRQTEPHRRKPASVWLKGDQVDVLATRAALIGTDPERRRRRKYERTCKCGEPLDVTHEKLAPVLTRLAELGEEEIDLRTLNRAIRRVSRRR